MSTQPLAGRTIAVPESREIELFAGLLERRGARVVRCPLVAIRDAPDPAPVLEWSHRLASGELDDLILLTGEGLKRILSCIERHEPTLRPRFLQAVGRMRKITRGPKPAKALRELGLKPEIAAQRPTTEGVLASLRGLDLRGHRIGVQLYGTEPNRPLVDFLESAGAAVASVAPYVYADAAESQAVLNLLEELRAGRIDAIAFTSSAQLERLTAVTSEDAVRSALANTLVAAVGPVVAEKLRHHGIAARAMPQESFFLKPLTSVLEEALKERARR
ncbi:MAG TPA: uroporphyrinogen-III synthase [Steroidobacteraceae bacterium]|nr:uroporphyrinogen-III synthase [Steroidobacteraceae bacterium]